MNKKIKHALFRFVTGYYNILLLFLFLLFIFRPQVHEILYFAIWKLILTCTLLSVIFNTNFSRKLKIITGVLALPAILFNWLNLWHTSEVIFVLNVAFTLIFLAICTAAILYHAIVITHHVSLDTLKGVICAYFMVAFFFAYIYYLVEYLHPNSFNFAKPELATFTFTHYISEMLYFSFTTLLTIGYGDITPNTDVGQTAAVLEGLVGQFYLAVLVARLIGLYGANSRKKQTKKFL